MDKSKRRQTDDRHAPERKERLGRWRRMSEERRDGVRRKMGFYVCVQSDFKANVFSCL